MPAKILKCARRASVVLALVLATSTSQAGDALKIKASSCVLEPHDRTLSGFVLNHTPGVVTALHGVADCTDIIVMQRTRNILIEVRVARVAVRNDLALLIPKNDKGASDLGSIEAFEPVLDSDDVKADDAVTAFGYPHGVLSPQKNDRLRLGDPTTERLGDIMGENQSDLILRKSPDPTLQVIKVSGLIVKGESGAPLAVQKANGRVIGVVIGSADPGASNIGWVMPLHNMIWESPTPNQWPGIRLPNSLASAVELKQEGQSRQYIVTLSAPGREDFQFSVTVAKSGALESVVPTSGAWQTVTIQDAVTKVVVARAIFGQPLQIADSQGNHDVELSNIGGSVALGVTHRPLPPTGLTVQ